jgi:hypothetical protein
MRVAVTGASGFIGRALVRALRANGHAVLGVGRLVAGRPRPDVVWDPARGTIDVAALRGVDAVFHLAGEPIAQRWSDTAKWRIRESRIEGTQLVSRAVAELVPRPRVLVSMSAIGYYGDRGDEELDESSARGTGFLAETAQAWEEAASAARTVGVRVVHPRLGIVLHREGGALAKMLPVFSLGGGGRIGSGQQWMSWIALDDVTAVLSFLLTQDDVAGPVNLTAPSPVRNRDFAATLGEALHRPAVIPLPALAVKAAFGAMGVETVLAGQRVLPRQLERMGYRFLHPQLRDALDAAL